MAFVDVAPVHANVLMVSMVANSQSWRPRFMVGILVVRAVFRPPTTSSTSTLRVAPDAPVSCPPMDGASAVAVYRPHVAPLPLAPSTTKDPAPTCFSSGAQPQDGRSCDGARWGRGLAHLRLVLGHEDLPHPGHEHACGDCFVSILQHSLLSNMI
jgi:hypothetical protein